ncbi:hypothetical protein VTJ83DRAFT_4263 [Remersonia thermophila]|uniref:Uncharacterized protein n=1 Tax=Remersonia thermophila TaxID=72144 RepID=A0ABR4D9H3_9PEZI
MYSAPYGYPNAAAGPIFNGAPPQGAHLQPGQPQGQPQQMMFNGQQFPMPGQPGAFPAGPNPSMMAGTAGPAGIMQNPAMPHMAANGQMAFQAPFTTGPYMAGVASTAPPQPQLPANFMMAGQMGSYPMGAGVPGQQPMMQRMQQAQQAQQGPAGMSVSTPQRPFNPPQGTPTSSMPPQQPPVSTPQTRATPPTQTPTTAQPPQPSSIATPQTPTFPGDQAQPPANGTSVVGSAPQSPASDSRDKERMSVLLEINQELLYESIQLVNSRNELKKQQATADASGQKSGDVDYAEEEKLANIDYNHCMKRLQANLTYMFALADRKGKPQIPPSPAYLTPPPLNLNLRIRLPPPSGPDDPIERPADPVADRAERDQLIKSLYKKLQALYPGVDPNKEPNPNQLQAGASKPGGPGMPGGAIQGSAGGNPAAHKGPNGATPTAMGSQTAATPVSLGQASNQNSPAATPTLAQTHGTPQMGNAVAPGLLMQQGGLMGQQPGQVSG